MPHQISRTAYAHMFGPTTGDRVRLADTELIVEVEADRTDLRRGGEVRRRQGHPRRHGPEPGEPRRGRRRYRHHQRPDHRPLGHRQGRRRPEGRPDRRDRQGRQPGRAAGRRHRHRPGDRGDRRRRAHPDRRRHRCAHPLDLPTAGGRRALFRHHDDAGRRHRPRRRDQRHDMHARPVASRADAAGGGEPSRQHRLLRQGQRGDARRPHRAGGGRRLRAEAARGLGNDARRHRLLPDGRR